jgi:hypothetical protein
MLMVTPIEVVQKAGRWNRKQRKERKSSQDQRLFQPCHRMRADRCEYGWIAIHRDSTCLICVICVICG